MNKNTRAECGVGHRPAAALGANRARNSIKPIETTISIDTTNTASVPLSGTGVIRSSSDTLGENKARDPLMFEQVPKSGRNVYERLTGKQGND